MKNIYSIFSIIFVFAIIVLVLILQKVYPGGYSDLLNKFGYKTSSQYENYARINPTSVFEEDTIIENTPTRVSVDFSQITSYTNYFLGITFDYVPNATIEQICEGGEAGCSDIFGYYVQHPNLRAIDIFLDDNPKNLTAQEWYMSKRSDYHPTLMQEIGQLKEGSSSILIVGQPSTCKTAPMLVVFISRNGKVYTLWQTSVNDEPQTTLEIQTILSNLQFNDGSRETISIPKDLLNYPSSENIQIDCPK